MLILHTFGGATVYNKYDNNCTVKRQTRNTGKGRSRDLPVAVRPDAAEIHREGVAVVAHLATTPVLDRANFTGFVLGGGGGGRPDSFSAVSKPNFGGRHSFESS